MSCVYDYQTLKLALNKKKPKKRQQLSRIPHMWGFFSSIYPLLFIWEGAERYVDKLIHSDQENLRPPQRSVVLFTVYAFNTLALLHGQATGKLRACNTVKSKHKALKYEKLKECIWRKAVVRRAPFFSALISGQMPFTDYKFTVYTFSTKLVCLIQLPVNRYGDDLLRWLFSCHSVHTGMSIAQEKPESTDGWQPCTLSHHACEDVCSKQVPWSVHRRVSTDRTWSPGINRLHPPPFPQILHLSDLLQEVNAPPPHTPACRSAPRTQQVSRHSAVSATKPQATRRVHARGPAPLHVRVRKSRWD